MDYGTLGRTDTETVGICDTGTLGQSCKKVPSYASEANGHGARYDGNGFPQFSALFLDRRDQTNETGEGSSEQGFQFSALLVPDVTESL
ncbi:MAG: hypothetical protein L0387_36655 [Acidobacteria bacterium]|nr:hypothetical protein [Acidobacteriota bacterium]